MSSCNHKGNNGFHLALFVLTITAILIYHIMTHADIASAKKELSDKLDKVLNIVKSK